MRVLIIGYSLIVQRRVLHALADVGIVEIDVASRRGGPVDLPAGCTGRVFNDYAAALQQSKADVVYISTPNSLHVCWAEMAIDRGFHVIVDKPAGVDRAETERLVDAAKAKDRCVAESTVYSYHPQFATVKGLFEQAGDRIVRVLSAFTFPPLSPDNFRYKKEMGGGALLDLGPYAVSVGRVLLEEEPVDVICRVVEKGHGVDTSFSMLTTYSGGRSTVGHFGFTTAYANRVVLLGTTLRVTVDRAFTTPADMENSICVRDGSGERNVVVPAADSFALFFRAVFDAIEKGDYGDFAAAMLGDARMLARMRDSAETDEKPRSDYVD